MLTPFYRGDTWSIDIDLSAYSVDIAGHILTVTLKSELADTDADAVLQHEYTVPSGAPATAGLATITIGSDDTDTIAPGEYHGDIQWNQGGSPPVVLTILASGEGPDGEEREKQKVLADKTRTAI